MVSEVPILTPHRRSSVRQHHPIIQMRQLRLGEITEIFGGLDGGAGEGDVEHLRDEGVVIAPTEVDYVRQDDSVWGG